MAEGGRTVAEVLRYTDETLETVRLGFEDFNHAVDPARRWAGFSNFVTFGRSVTIVLQGLRSADKEHFEAWYEPFKQEMKADPLMRMFVTLRNRVLKEGTPGRLSHSSTYERISFDDIAKLPRPPGATGFFMGDHRGGSGWEIEQPDGSKEKYYIQLPEEWGQEQGWHLDEPPTEHLGKPLTDTSLHALCRLYLGYLTEIVQKAHAEFEARS